MAKKKRSRKLKSMFSRKKRGKDSPKLPWWALIRRVRQKKEREEGESAPRITNDTVAEHREAVLSGARRFVYPLQHSRHRVVIISTVIVALVLVSSLVFSSLLLYRYQSTSNFAYRVSRVIPFPVAKIDSFYVSYEDYLFEARNSIFYIRNHGQEEVDIDSEAGDALITQLKKDALLKVKLDALAKKIAKENEITISSQEVEDQIARIRLTGGVGSSDEALNDILRNFYDWDIDDLRKTIYNKLVRQKLPRVLDTETVTEAQRALQELKDGGDFNELAEKFSDDPLTADNGGVIGLISRTNTDLPAEFIEGAFNLEEGETSELIESRFGLHIIKNQKVEGDQIEVAHILFNYFDINQYLLDRLAESDVKDYITLE